MELQTILKSFQLLLVVFIIIMLQHEVEASKISGWGSPETLAKPGNCPASDPSKWCASSKDLCQSDCECPQKQKCCLQDTCGLACKEPTVIVENVATCDEKIAPSIKPGTCPAPLDNIRCFQCYDQCKSDCECEGLTKCCKQNGCGNWCKNSTENGGDVMMHPYML